MNLRIFLPFGIFATVTDVSSLVAETQHGSFGLLPARLDCVAALTPGILTYTAGNGPVYLAADEGVLIKQGSDVSVSIRRCIRGDTLDLLHEAVRRDFLAANAQAETIRRVLTTMEGSMIGRLVELQRER